MHTRALAATVLSGREQVRQLTHFFELNEG
jgi:hypothetical protein